jgi:hypothetical protein
MHDGMGDMNGMMWAWASATCWWPQFSCSRLLHSSSTCFSDEPYRSSMPEETLSALLVLRHMQLIRD